MPALQAAPPHHCPKCRGHVLVERDVYGTYGSCLSCGYVHDVLDHQPVDLAAEEAARPTRQRRRRPSYGNQSL
jgi:ribosomal protein L37AE/L43A